MQFPTLTLVRYCFPKNPNQIFSVLRHATACPQNRCCGMLQPLVPVNSTTPSVTEIVDYIECSVQALSGSGKKHIGMYMQTVKSSFLAVGYASTKCTVYLWLRLVTQYTYTGVVNTLHEYLPLPCHLWGPPVGIVATSPLRSRGSPTLNMEITSEEGLTKSRYRITHAHHRGP